VADHHFPSRDGWRKDGPDRECEDEIPYLLRAEGDLLQAISGRAPLPQVLTRICEALDSELGNMISIFSLPDDDAPGLDAIAKSATLFRLYKFCSVGVVDGNGEQLGTLEMYCSVARRPHAGEAQLIERATWLAAIAIERQRSGPA